MLPDEAVSSGEAFERTVETQVSLEGGITEEQLAQLQVVFSVYLAAQCLPPNTGFVLTITRVNRTTGNIVITFPPGKQGTSGALQLLSGFEREDSLLLKPLQSVTGPKASLALLKVSVPTPGGQPPPSSKRCGPGQVGQVGHSLQHDGAAIDSRWPQPHTQASQPTPTSNHLPAHTFACPPAAGRRRRRQLASPAVPPQPPVCLLTWQSWRAAPAW